MKKNDYLKYAFDNFNSGKISAEAYDYMVQNADVFCEDEEYDDGELERLAEESNSEADYESLESYMFRAAMEQSERETTQDFKVAYKIQCSGKCFEHFIRNEEKDSVFISLREAEDFCEKESGPYNRLGIELTPVEVRIPIKSKVEKKEHSTYKNMRFISNEER